MNIRNRGFIPLVVIVLLGIAVAAGGTVATMSIRESKLSNTTATTTSEQEASLPPISPRVESSMQSTTSVTVGTKKEPVVQIEQKTTGITVLDSQSQTICNQIREKQPESAKRSLIQDMQVICEMYAKGAYQGERLDSAKKMLQEKWVLWLKTQEERKDENNKLVASCVADRPIINNDEKVTFTAEASGGIAPYTYEWLGSAISGLTTQSVTTQFGKAGKAVGFATARVVVESADKQIITATCSVQIRTSNQSTQP